MSKNYVPILCLAFLPGCYGATDESDAGPPTVDAYTPTDAGPAPTPETDAGADAGAVSSCSDELPNPTAWDCATSEPSGTVGAAIEAEARTWTWVDFPDARCMNGSATGIGVNLNPDSDRVLIMLEGGGACFDPISCAGVANQDGFDAAKFATYGTRLSSGTFDRDESTNPFADWSYVYVPYCTGDVHGGTVESSSGGRVHVGYFNMSLYLERLVPTFADATTVVLAGRSAGGLGTLINFPQVQEAFDCIPVHVLDDAGSLLPEPYLRECLQRTVRDRWGLDTVVPDDCPECTCEAGGGLWKVFAYLGRRYPESRFALMTTTADTTMRQFYGYGYAPACNFPQQMPATDFEAGLLGLRASVDTISNVGTFYVAGTNHTFSYDTLSNVRVDGDNLADWVSAMIEGEETWGHVGP